MRPQTLAAILAALFALPAAAINVPLPPEPPLVPVAPEPPSPDLTWHVAAADAARAMAEDARRAGEDARRAAEEVRRQSEDLSRDIEAEMGALFAQRVTSHRIVKGQPYSAEVLTENRQALADGNVISRKTVGRVYRDADGRTRDETEAREGKSRSIVIFDPVAGKSTVLLPESKRAIVTPAHGSQTHMSKVVTVDGTVVRVEDGRVSVNGKPVPDGTVQLKAKSGREIRVENGRVFIDGKETPAPADSKGKRVIVTREEVDGMPLETVDVKVIRVGENPGPEIAIAPLPPMPPPPPAPGVAPLAPLPPVPPLPGVSGSFRFESTARLGKGVTASLGTKELDGVRAEGKSTTWTIPAGQIGNAKPINVVSETWYAPELQVTVYSRYSDPRTGESIYRLGSIKRGAPGADLFLVPAGYQVRDRSQMIEENRSRAREAHEKAREERQRALEERRHDLEEQRHRLEEQQRQLDEERRKGG